MDDNNRQKVVINGTKNGLGIRIVGGRSFATTTLNDQEPDFGIFIKEVIKGSLAEKDGRLERGDQVIEANGSTLIGVSNEDAVEILKNCAVTNQISLLISRDPKSQNDFRRLSNTLLRQPVPTAQQNGGSPIATSTPRGAGDAAVDIGDEKQYQNYPPGRELDRQEMEARRSSTSSELTQISTTDISSQGDDLQVVEDNDEVVDASKFNKNTANAAAPNHRHLYPSSGTGNSSPKSGIALSDVVVTVDSTTAVDEDPYHVRSASGGSGDPPPPVPPCPPPDIDTEQDLLISPKKRTPESSEVAMAAAGSAVADVVLRSRSPPEGESMSPPLSATLSVSPTLYIASTSTHSFAIPKQSGLGVIIGGGLNRHDGPQIFIDKILDGMDAARDGRLKKGDRIIAVNGESFKDLTREKALTTLTQLKIRTQVKTYTMTIERTVGVEKDTTGPPTSLSQPERTTHSNIFNSDTLPASEAKRSKAAAHDKSESYLKDVESPMKAFGSGSSPMKKNTPSRYLPKKESGGKSERDKHDSLHKRLSMDPHARCKLAKLEWALNYMGYIMTPQQQQKMHSALDIDEDGRVIFVEFVKLTQEMFSFRLDDAHLEANLVYALTQREGTDMPPSPRKATSFDQLWREYSPVASPMKLTSSQPTLPQSPLSSSEIPTSHHDVELDHMRRQLHDLGKRRDKERLSSDAAKLELAKEKALTAQLREQLIQKEQQAHEAGLQLHEMSSEGSSEEAHVLKKRVGLAEAAVRAQRDKANQLEDSMRAMEAELTVLRENQPEMNLEELRRRLAIVDTELKKEKSASRRFQVATEKLMQFVENCHEALVKTPEVDRILYHPHGKGESVLRGNTITGNPRPPQYLSRHAKMTTTSLAQEAQDTMAAVRKMLQVDALPFGWEEVYTEDGQKYFVNHETQTTSWVHPVTKVNSNRQGGSQSSTPVENRSHVSSHSSLQIGRELPRQPRVNQQA